MSQFAVTYNGLTIDSSSDYSISRAEGLAGLPVRLSERPKTGSMGSTIFNSLYDSRLIVFEGVVKGSDAGDYFDNRNALINAFSITSNTTLQITRWDGEIRRINAKVVTPPVITDVYGLVNHGRYRVELKAEDPFLLDGTLTSETINLASASGFPLSAPVSTPLGQLEDNATTINNAGGVAWYAEFVFAGELENSTLTNSTTGEHFTISNTIPSGSTVTVSQSASGLSVLLNNTTNWIQYFDGDNFMLQIGNNTLRLTATSGDGSCTVNFRNPYLSL